MDVYTVTEMAYKNGYEQGLKDAIKYGEWRINPDGYYPYCSKCGEEPKSGIMTNYCPNCGTNMKGEIACQKLN